MTAAEFIRSGKRANLASANGRKEDPRPEGIICRRHMRSSFAKLVKANKRVDSAPR